MIHVIESNGVGSWIGSKRGETPVTDPEKFREDLVSRHEDVQVSSL